MAMSTNHQSRLAADEEWHQFLLTIKKRVAEGDESIPERDLARYRAMVGERGYDILMDQWREAIVRRKQRDLIADATRECPSDENPAWFYAQRTNRLLAAILEKLTERK